MLAFLCFALIGQMPLSEQITKINADFAALEKSFYDELNASRNDNAKITEANRVYNEKWGQARDKVTGLILEHPDDPSALDGITVLVGPMRSFLTPKLMAIALRNRNDPRMGQICFYIRQRGREGWPEELAKAVAASNPSRDVRGQATYCLAELARDAAFPYGETLAPERRDPLVAKARGFYNAVLADYADAKSPDGKTTLGDMATHQLRRFDNLPNLKVGGIAPEIAGEDLDGKPLKLSDYRGKVVVVAFWGSWCGPCMAMVPQEKALWERNKDKPFAMLGVNCGDKRELAQKTAAFKQMGWPSFYDGEETRGPINTEYDIQHWPTVFVIDSKGVIRHFDVRGKELDQAVDALLAEKVGE